MQGESGEGWSDRIGPCTGGRAQGDVSMQNRLDAASPLAGIAQFVDQFVDPGDPEYSPPVTRAETRVRRQKGFRLCLACGLWKTLVIGLGGHVEASTFSLLGDEGGLQHADASCCQPPSPQACRSTFFIRLPLCSRLRKWGRESMCSNPSSLLGFLQEEKRQRIQADKLEKGAQAVEEALKTCKSVAQCIH